MVHSKPVNKCIYCGSQENLTDEHIVPLGLSGMTILDKASCLACNKVTSALEGHVQHVYLGKVRSALKTKTRHPENRKNEFPVTLHKKDNSQEIVNLQVNDHPNMIVFPQFPLPGFTRGNDPAIDDGLSIVGAVSLQMGGANLQAFSKTLKESDITAFDQEVELEPIVFARFLAKVAYCAAVWHYGIECFEETFILPAILGQEGARLGHWVGTIPQGEGTLGTEGAHLTNFSIASSSNPITNRSILVRVKLFAVFDPPEYAVIVGRLKEECISPT